jgi:uncharacterized protein YaiL (DUF2058 family)
LHIRTFPSISTPLMQNLRDKLMSAGLIDETQKVQADERAERRSQRGGRRRRRSRALPYQPVSSSSSSSSSPSPEPSAVARIVDAHRVRGDTRGDKTLEYMNREGTVRTLDVTAEVLHGVKSGRFAVIEVPGAPRAALVERAALEKIQAVDPEAIRALNTAS